MRFLAARREALLLWVAPLLLIGACLFGDRAFLPRHSELQDLPWARRDANLEIHEPFNSAFSDPVNLILPDVHFAREEFSRGNWPLWNPHVFSGTAQVANPLAATFYPPQWVATLFDPIAAMAFMAALHLLLCGFFFRFWMSELGLGKGAALFGAMSFQCSGWMAAHLHNHPIVASLAWIVLAFAALEWRFNTGRKMPLVVFATALGLSWLSGFPQVAFLGSAALCLYAVARLLFSPRGTCKTHALPLAAALLLGFGIASVQVLPVLASRADAARQAATAESLVPDRMRPSAITGWLFPRTLGDPTAVGDWRSEPLAQFFLGEGTSSEPVAAMNWSELTLYPGWMVLLLAAMSIGLVRSRALLLFAVLTALALVHAFCAPAIHALAHVPGFNIGAPLRSTLFLVLLLPALAAASLHALQQLRDLESAAPARTRRLVLWIITLFLCVSAALVNGFPAAVSEHAAAWLQGTERGTELGLTNLSVSALSPLLTRAVGRLGTDLLMAALASVTLMMALEVSLRRRGWDVSVLLALCSAVELLLFALPVNLPVRREGLFEPTPAMEFLTTNTRAHERLIRVSKDRETALAEADRLLIPNLPSLHGLNDTQGWREQVPRHVFETWRWVVAATNDVAMSGISAESVHAPLLDVARVRWLVASEPIPALAATQVFPSGGRAKDDLVIYENAGILPEAWVVHSARSGSTAQAAAWLREIGSDVANEAVVDASFPLPPLAPRIQDDVRVVRHEPTHFVFDVRAGSSGILIVPETFDSGWIADITSGSSRRELSPLRCNGQFMGVPVPAGQHEVHLRFAPRSVRLGLVFAALSLGALMVMVCWPERAPPRMNWP